MPLPAMNKTLVVAAGVTGAGILAWQTMFPWIKYDLQLLQADGVWKHQHTEHFTFIGSNILALPSHLDVFDGSKAGKGMEEALSSFIIDKFEVFVDEQPKKVMLIFEDCLYTYEFIELQANKVANTMRQQGFKCGDTVALMAQNEPALIWTFLGCQKLGVAVALINYNVRVKQLSFTILSAEPKALLVGAGKELQEAVSAILEDLHGMPVLVHGLASGQAAPEGMQDFDTMMMRALPVRPHRSLRSEMTPDSLAAYIFTSGTTGLPKPVYIRQSKASGFTCSLQLVDLRADDIVYTALPLYHTAGFGVGLLGILCKGNTMVLRRKFSRLSVLVRLPEIQCDHCPVHWGTLQIPLGTQPKHELDSVHKVRVAYGNGLRKDIFKEVLERYKIPLVCEFYAATEGVSALFNIANKPGAIGRLSPLLNRLSPYPSWLVKFDYSSALPIRDKNGRCIKVKTGEPGLLISQVPDNLIAKGDLTVYKASRKLIRKSWCAMPSKMVTSLHFNYGDVLCLDSEYFVYFHDRIGDTFRWKGENVSTTEVANVLTTPHFIVDVTVYGVTVPGHDGRAGMAAITLNEGQRMTAEWLKEVYRVCQDGLPAYARPLFLRILPEAVMTGTFKQQKVQLVEEGYDLTKVKDDMYYYNSNSQTHSLLTSESYVSFLQSRL